MSKKCRSCGQSLPVEQFHLYVKSGKPRPDCKNCHNKQSTVWRAAHIEEARAHARKSREVHLERRRAESTAWRKVHREEGRRLTRIWTERNKLRILARRRARRAECLGVCPRCAAIIKATPAWLTLDQKLSIHQMYLNCPEGEQVDHIIPIKGKEVCGLNVPWNLQYLSKEANMKKGNRIV